MARGASYLIAKSLVTAVISLASFAVVARAISRSDMGGLAVLSLVSAATYVVGGLGVGSTAVRYVASLQSKSDYEGTRKVGYECLMINGVATLFIAAVTYLSANTLALLLLGSAARGNLFKLLIWEILALGVNYSLSNLALGLKCFRSGRL